MTAIPQTMKQLVIAAPGQVEWQDAPVPTPRPDEVLIRVSGVSTCPHWDIHITEGKPMFPGQDLKYPYVPGQPGHEAVGMVVAKGEAVQNLDVGQSVAAWRDTGEARQGFYAQFNVFREVDLLPISEDLEPIRIASLELAMCVEVSFQQLHAFTAMKGKSIAVAGLGPAGLVAIQLARYHGAVAVVGIDPVAERRELARQLGASDVRSGAAEDWPASRTDENAVDLAIDCTGLAPVVEFLLHRTREAVVLFGVVRQDIRYNGNLMWGPGVSLLGYGDHNRAAANTAYAAVEADALDLSTLITTTLPMSDYLSGVEQLRQKRAIKVLFDPWI